MAEGRGEEPQGGKRETREEIYRSLTEMWQGVLREELRHLRDWRPTLEEHEKIIGRKVKQLRLERGWTQEQLAEKMGEHGWPMHQTTIAKLEAGTRPLRVAEADALALAFGLPMVALLYLPVQGEPWGLAQMRTELQTLDEQSSLFENTLRMAIISYADHQFRRLRLLEAMREAALAAERSELDMGLSQEVSQRFVEELNSERERHGSAPAPEASGPEGAAEQREWSALMDRIQADEPEKVAAAAWHLYQSGANLGSVAEFVAGVMRHAGTLDPLQKATETTHSGLERPARAAEAGGSTTPEKER